MSTQPFRLFRFYHANGSAKDWCYRNLLNGTAEIRWGSADRLYHWQIKSLTQALIRAEQKEAKGYLFLGCIQLDERGNRVPT